MHRLIALLALTMLIPSAGPPAACRVTSSSTPTITPGIYRVNIALASTCGTTDTARVRLESFIGGTYPRNGWVTISKTRSFSRLGVPWYWRGARLVGEKRFAFVIPGMEAP